MRKLILSAILLLSACAPSAEVVQQAIRETQSAWTPIPTQTAYPTYTAAPTKYIIVYVTSTATRTPIFTPEPTTDPLYQTRGNGFYIVGTDIAPGVWRSDGTNDSCYWAVTEADGDIINNHFGMAGGTAYIPASAFQVEFSDCGDWTFISNP